MGTLESLIMSLVAISGVAEEQGQLLSGVYVQSNQ